MKPIDFRNATYEEIRKLIVAQRSAVWVAWIAHGPATTRQAAKLSGIDLLTFRPRTTELYQLGGVCLVDSEELMVDGTEGIYRARTDAEWRAWLEQKRAGLISHQMPLPLDSVPSQSRMNKFPEILPGAGSKLRPCAKACTCEHCRFWRELEQRECPHCRLKLGESETFWILIWDTGSVEHLQCRDEFIDMEKAALGAAGCIDGAVWRFCRSFSLARKLGLTQRAFKELPRYEQERHAREYLDSTYPEWRARITAELATRRALSPSVPSVTSVPSKAA